jgi:hypothetical protein
MSGPGNSPLFEIMFSLGTTPLVRQTIREAVRVVSRRRLDVIVVDAGRCREDPVELLLNVRDVAPHLPALVVGPLTSGAMSEMIVSLGNVRFLKALPERRAFSQAMNGVLSANRSYVPQREKESS